MKKIYIAVGVILLAVIAFVLLQKYDADFIKNSETGDKTQDGKLVTGSDKETFSGTIEAVDTGCFYDAVCSVTVSGKKIILIAGGRGLPPDTKVGRLIGVDSVGDLEQKIGEHANVYATTTPEGDYSIYGNDNYYVEVVTIKQN